jgi:hypothetical protein
MRVVRLILIVAAVGFAYHHWTERREYSAMKAVMSPNGFLPVPMPPDAEPNTVLLFTPLNCPREASQRAIALSEELTRQGIRNLRTSRYAAASFEPSPETLASFKRLNKVMTGDIPIVLINGMGKSNPTVAEVVAEYARTK